MSDRELLELAAKAADMDIGFDRPRATGKVPLDWDTGQPWNPLTDDGDAFRLAVNLGFRVQCVGTHTEVYTKNSYVFGECGDDPYSATRRAIVKAAAEIGRGK